MRIQAEVSILMHDTSLNIDRYCALLGNPLCKLHATWHYAVLHRHFKFRGAHYRWWTDWIVRILLRILYNYVYNYVYRIIILAVGVKVVTIAMLTLCTGLPRYSGQMGSVQTAGMQPQQRRPSTRALVPCTASPRDQRVCSSWVSRLARVTGEIHQLPTAVQRRNSAAHDGPFHHHRLF